MARSLLGVPAAMLRVACKCGKTLGVTDDFAGKQVRCPACLSVIDVPGPASAGAPAPGNAPALPRRRRSPFAVLALLFGGATIVLLALAGAAIAVLLWLKPWVKPDTSPGSAANPVPVRLYVPPRVGDRREVTLTFDADSQEDTKSDAGKQSRQISDKVQLSATVRTLAVDKEGRETRREFTVKKFTHVSSSGQEKAVLPEGAVFLVDGYGSKATVRATGPTGTPPGLQAAFARLQGATFEDLDLTADAVLGTGQKQAVGGTWPVNRQELARWLKRYVELTVEPETINATGKLAAAPKEGDAYALDFEASATAPLDAALTKANAGGGKATGKALLSWSGRYPADYATGPQKSSLKLDASFHLAGTDTTPQKDVTLKVQWSQAVSYLPAAKGPEPTNPGRSGAYLSAAKVRRSLAGNELELSVRFSLPRDSGTGSKAWYFAVEFKGRPAPDNFVEAGKAEATNLQADGEWTARLKLAEPPPPGTAFVLYLSDEPLTGAEARKQASQVQGVVE